MTSRAPMRMPIIVTVVVVGLLAAGTTAAWTLSKVEHAAQGSATNHFTIDCDFGKFRQIMVRKNATEAIVSRGGMSLLDERVDDLKIDSSGDDRPLLNAIRGKSKSEIEAVKQLTVRLSDPSIDADRLVLRQVAEMTADQFSVETKSKEPAGNLESYQTSLHARPVAGGTEVTVAVSMEVRVQVPKIFTARADAKVQQAAEDAVAEQSASIKSFIAQHVDKRLILPSL